MARKKKAFIVAIIPARFASTRFPGKLLVNIQGKTLIQRTYENARRCTFIDEVVVAADDERIFQHVTSLGAKAVMTPVDCPTGSDRIAYVVEHSKALQKADIILNLQGDEPCVDLSTVSSIAQALLEDSSAFMSTAVTPIRNEEEASNPSDVKCVLDLNGNVLYFSRALIPCGFSKGYDPQRTYYKHIGIYSFRPDSLLKFRDLPMTPLQKAEDLEQLKVLEHGYKIKAAIVNSSCIGVNTPEDIKKLEQELCKQNLFS